MAKSHGVAIPRCHAMGIEWDRRCRTTQLLICTAATRTGVGCDAPELQVRLRRCVAYSVGRPAGLQHQSSAATELGNFPFVHSRRPYGLLDFLLHICIRFYLLVRLDSWLLGILDIVMSKLFILTAAPPRGYSLPSVV